MNYLLDTNILVYSLSKPEFEQHFNQNYPSALHRLFISVVTEGELNSIALQRNWGTRKQHQMQQLLEGLLVVPIKVRSIINAYARIDAYSQGKFAGKPLPAGMSSRNMGKNDLWIAATAHVTDATLVTTDNDFGHLDRAFFPLDRIDIRLFI